MSVSSSSPSPSVAHPTTGNAVSVHSEVMGSSKWSNPARSLFFGNLSYFCSADDLRSLTQPFGISKKCHICRSPNGDSLFYGFVEFEENVNVDFVVQSLNSTLFMGRFIRYVSAFILIFLVSNDIPSLSCLLLFYSYCFLL